VTIDRFMVFAAVAKHNSTTRASEELHISQPAVSKQLKLLERNYNTKLFVRTGKGMQLTQTGRAFLRDVNTVLKRYKALSEKFRAAGSESKLQTLTVGGSYSPSVYLLPSLLALFQKSHPHVQLDLRTNNRAVIERMVLNSEVDIAVINNATSNHLLTTESYRQESLVAFVAKNHPLRV
jgi:DNA-binding transcriptional LysR family regulator